MTEREGAQKKPSARKRLGAIASTVRMNLPEWKRPITAGVLDVLIGSGVGYLFSEARPNIKAPLLLGIVMGLTFGVMPTVIEGELLPSRGERFEKRKKKAEPGSTVTLIRPGSLRMAMRTAEAQPPERIVYTKPASKAA